MDIPIVVTLSKEAVAGLVKLEREVVFPTWNSDLFLREFENPYSTTYGIRLRGALVGYLIVHLVLDEVHIVNLVIAKSNRRKGLAYLLLDSVLSDLAWEGARAVYLEVRRSNGPAKRLYGSMGFGETGIREKYYSNNQEDALLMRLDLQDYMQQKLLNEKQVVN